MPLLEVIQTKQVSASIRLTDTIAAQVDQYAHFIHAEADDVVEQALSYVFAKDPRLSGVPEVATSEAGHFHASRSEGSRRRDARSSSSEARSDVRCGSSAAGEKRMSPHYIPGLQAHSVLRTGGRSHLIPRRVVFLARGVCNCLRPLAQQLSDSPYATAYRAYAIAYVS